MFDITALVPGKTCIVHALHTYSVSSVFSNPECSGSVPGRGHTANILLPVDTWGEKSKHPHSEDIKLTKLFSASNS